MSTYPLGDFGERVAAAHLEAPGQNYGDPAGVDDSIQPAPSGNVWLYWHP